MKTFKWAIFLLALTALLAACSTPAPKSTPGTATITLIAEPNVDVPVGSSVDLTLIVDEGDVRKVDFSVKGDAPFALDVVASGAEGSFFATFANIQEDTTFVAAAKNAAGDTLASAEVNLTVEVTPPATADPQAPSASVEGLEGVATVSGTATPRGLSLVVNAVAGVEGDVQEALGKESAQANTFSILAGTDALSFIYTPDDGFTGEDSFSYEVVKNEKTVTGTITVNVAALPADTLIVRSLSDIGSVAQDTTMLLAEAISCDADPCVAMKAGQKLMGGGVVGGVTLVNPDAKITADRSVAGEYTTVIELANDSSVEGLEILGPDIFTAIDGRAVNLSGTISIKNVTITGPTLNAPFAIRFVDNVDAFGAYYTLNVDGLNITNATNSIGINAFSGLEFKNSTITMNIDPVKKFGLDLHSYGTSTATVDNVKIDSETGAEDFAPLKVTQQSQGGIFTATLTNNDVSFADGVDLAAANAFFFNYGNNAATTGKIVLENSTGNTTEATTGAVTFDSESLPITDRIQGSITVNGSVRQP